MNESDLTTKGAVEAEWELSAQEGDSPDTPTTSSAAREQLTPEEAAKLDELDQKEITELYVRESILGEETDKRMGNTSFSAN